MYITIYVHVPLCNTSCTWGTHLGETKLVASITLSPVSESISINCIFISVGTVSYRFKKL